MRKLLLASSFLYTSLCWSSDRLQLQAPFDSYVCFESSFEECARRTLEENFSVLMQSEHWYIEGSGSVLPRSIRNMESSSHDGVIKCGSNGSSYKPTLNMRIRYPAVFVSPMLLIQLDDAFQRVVNVEIKCNQLIHAYYAQVELLELQDKQTIAQTGIHFFSAAIEAKSFELSKVEYPDAKENDLARFGINRKDKVKINDALLLSREAHLNYSQELREQTKKHMLSVEFPSQAADISNQHKQAITDLVRAFLALDASVSKINIARNKKGEIVGSRAVESNQWVSRGQAILRYKAAKTQ